MGKVDGIVIGPYFLIAVLFLLVDLDGVSMERFDGHDLFDTVTFQIGRGDLTDLSLQDEFGLPFSSFLLGRCDFQDA